MWNIDRALTFRTINILRFDTGVLIIATIIMKYHHQEGQMLEFGKKLSLGSFKSVYFGDWRDVSNIKSTCSCRGPQFGS